MSAGKYIFDHVLTSLSIVGTKSRFPVRRVFCIGKNYEDHVAEMGGALKDYKVDQGFPVLFTKPADALIDVSGPKAIVPLPRHSKSVHWEAELVVALGKGGSNIDANTAVDHIFGFGVGIDMTARDIQEDLKKKSRPWDISKGFDFSGPIGPILPKADFGSIANQRLQLTVNGEIRQNATLDKMIWSIPRQIAILSQIYELKPGDIIFTGTPSGVNQMQPGDKLSATCFREGETSGPRLHCNFTVGPYL